MNKVEYSHTVRYFSITNEQAKGTNKNIEAPYKPNTEQKRKKSWRRLLRVLWTARKSNQSLLKEISPKYSLEGLMLKLMLQYFDHLMSRANSLKRP